MLTLVPQHSSFLTLSAAAQQSSVWDVPIYLQGIVIFISSMPSRNILYSISCGDFSYLPVFSYYKQAVC
jgi:hypothetical protein